jgi:hypothetical protein
MIMTDADILQYAKDVIANDRRAREGFEDRPATSTELILAAAVVRLGEERARLREALGKALELIDTDHWPWEKYEALLRVYRGE